MSQSLLNNGHLCNTIMIRAISTLLLFALAAAVADERCDRIRERLAAVVYDCANECPTGRPNGLVEAAEHLACPDICVLARADLLDDEGMPSQSKIEALFEGKPRVQRAVGRCRDRAMNANRRRLARHLASKLPGDVDQRQVVREFRGLSYQDKITVRDAARLSMFSDCLGMVVERACPTEEAEG